MLAHSLPLPYQKTKKNACYDLKHNSLPQTTNIQYNRYLSMPMKNYTTWYLVNGERLSICQFQHPHLSLVYTPLFFWKSADHQHLEFGSRSDTHDGYSGHSLCRGVDHEEVTPPDAT